MVNKMKNRFLSFSKDIIGGDDINGDKREDQVEDEETAG